jgi:hypothetical protein
MIFHGDSSYHAKIHQAITIVAHAAIAFAMSPLCWIHPSAITGTVVALAHFSTALNCGQENHVLSLVVHTDQGHIQILTELAHRFSRSCTHWVVQTFPAMINDSGNCFLQYCIICFIFLQCPCAMSIVM